MFIIPMTWHCCQIQLNHSSFIIQTLKKWNERRLLTVKDLVKEMIVWQKGRYLDPEIWDHLCSRINPALMQEPSVLQEQISELSFPSEPPGSK